MYIYGGGDFGFGIASTSYIKDCSNIKSKIKSIYHIIPSFSFIRFLRESEFRIKNNKKIMMNYCLNSLNPMIALKIWKML